MIGRPVGGSPSVGHVTERSTRNAPPCPRDRSRRSDTYDPAANNVTETCEKAGDIQGSEFVNLQVRIEVFNVAGRRIEVLAERVYPAGTHFVSWDASAAASGVYYYRILADGFSATKRMVLLK